MVGHEGPRAGALAGEEALAKAWLELAKARPSSGARGAMAHLFSAPSLMGWSFSGRVGVNMAPPTQLAFPLQSRTCFRASRGLLGTPHHHPSFLDLSARHRVGPADPMRTPC